MVNTALKNQLFYAFYKPYLSMLKKEYTGYATKTTLEIIQHIYTHYARISVIDTSANEKRIQSP